MPVIWRYEVSAVLVKSVKDGILTPEKADALFLLLDSLNITLDPESADRFGTGDPSAASSGHAR